MAINNISILIVGLLITGLGVAKVYGYTRGIEGGKGKPVIEQICGT